MRLIYSRESQRWCTITKATLFKSMKNRSWSWDISGDNLTNQNFTLFGNVGYYPSCVFVPNWSIAVICPISTQLSHWCFCMRSRMPEHSLPRDCACICFAPTITLEHFLLRGANHSVCPSSHILYDVSSNKFIFFRFPKRESYTKSLG